MSAAAVVALTACGSNVRDPESARCSSPQVKFFRKVVLSDHAEVDGPLSLRGRGDRRDAEPAEGSRPVSGGRLRALERRGLALDVGRAVGRAGIAFFSYDKRGVGESEGVCCPGDESHFNLLAADADGPVNAIRRRPEIDPARIGFLGASQAGWVVPLAVVRSRGRVAFTALADGPAVTTGEEATWSKRAGEESDNPPVLTKEKKAELERHLEPSGFDPVPLLRRMTIPGIWVYGGRDHSQPSDASAANLERLRRTAGKDFTVVVFPRADHGLLDTPPTDPRAAPTLVSWLRSHTAAR